MRRLLAVGSVAGAPGATTVALALGAAWPVGADGGVRPVVMETGVWGGDIAARFGLAHTPGLLDVASCVQQAQPGSLLAAVHELPFGCRAVLAPAGRDPCTEAVRLLSAAADRCVLRGEEPDRGSVLLDVGRMTAEVQGLVERADEVLLVTRGGPEALAHVYAHPLVSSAPDRVRLCVVGRCPYPPDEIRTALGVERVTCLPWDAGAAAVLCGARQGRLPTDGFRAPPLMTAARELAERLAQTHGQPVVRQRGSQRGSLAEVLKERSSR